MFLLLAYARFSVTDNLQEQDIWFLFRLQSACFMKNKQKWFNCFSFPTDSSPVKTKANDTVCWTKRTFHIYFCCKIERMHSHILELRCWVSWVQLKVQFRELTHFVQKLHMVGTGKISTAFTVLHSDKYICVPVEHQYICINWVLKESEKVIFHKVICAW